MGFAGEYREQIMIKPGQTLYPLSHALIVVDSLAGAERYNYLIDALYGRLILLQAPQTNDTLEIFYQYSNINAPKKVDLGIAKITSWFPEERPRGGTALDDPSRVRTTGSISRQIEVGSTGQSMLSGGLDLRISGELAPGIYIKGVISDNDAPFQDYASTQSVRDVDNVLIQVYSERLHAEIGDIYVDHARDYWSRFNRKLIGAQARFRNETFSGSAFVGSARGRFRRQEVTARDGDQGPYRLVSESGDNAIMIVPQSEHVYLDGVLLEKSLYTMYYTDAELFFSSEIMISEASRIVVEYNFVNEFYSRSSLGASTSWRFGKHIRLQAGLVREKDDENNPTDIHLMKMPSDSLTQIVSSDGYFTITTAVPDTAGDYSMEGAIWVYRGEGQGSHFVYFYRENTNGGYIRTYTSEGRMVYEYAPLDPLSQYFPRRRVTLPTTQWMGTMQLELGQKGKAHALIDGAYASFDANNYSPLRPTRKPALKWDAQIPLSAWFVLGTQGWLKDPAFMSFSNLNEPEFERTLGFTSHDTVTRSASVSAQVSRPALRANTSLEYAYDTKENTRLRLLSNGNVNLGGIDLQYRWSHLLDDGFLPYYSLNASVRIPLKNDLSLTSSWMQDHFEPVFASSHAYRSETLRTGFIWQQWSMDYIYRCDYNWDAADTSFSAYSRKQDLALKFNRAFWDKRISLNTTATYRYDRREESNNHYILTSGQMGLQFGKIGISGNLKANINRTSETKREAVFIFVGDGLGNYRLDDYGNYVPDDMGNFILRSELTNERRDQYVSNMGTSLNWRKNYKKLNVQISHIGNSDYRTPDLVLFAPFNIDQPDTSILFANLRFRHEAVLGSVSGKHRVSFVFEDLRNQNFQTAYNENIYSQMSRRIRYRYKPNKLILDLYYTYAVKEQHRLPLNSYRVKASSNGTGLECEYLFSQKLRAGGGVKYEHIITQFNGVFPSHWLTMNTEWIWYRIAGERLFLSGTIDRVISDYSGSLPYETANGLPVGWSWSGAVRYEKRINQFVSAGGFVQFRKRAEQRGIVTANLEVKAYF
jgi:hypothetical protein